MKTRESKMEAGDWPVPSVLDCGGKRSATPLSEAGCPEEKRRHRCALPVPSKTWWRFVASLVFLAAALTASAQAYSIDWFKIAGGTSTGGVYAVSGTIGQQDAGGLLTNGVYSLTGGYWALPIAV